MRIILVRHAETEENKLQILQGPKIGKLSDLGKEQAKKAAERLKDEDIHVAYVSDAVRAVDTAKFILKFHPETDVIFSKEVRERAKGTLEGHFKREMKQAIQESGKPFFEWKPEGGESLLETQKRIRDFFDQIVEQYDEETILIVSHTATLSALLLSLLDKSFDEYDAHKSVNCGITIINIDKEANAKIDTLNCEKHLG